MGAALGLQLHGVPLRVGRGGGAALSALAAATVAYYQLDEASGNAVDATGRGNTLTDNNTVTSVAGKIGTARQFTAANSESLSRADNADFSGGAGVSLLLWGWANCDSLGAVRPLINKDSGGQREYGLYVNAAGEPKFYAFNAAAGANEIASGVVVVAGTPFFFCCGYDAVAAEVFLRIDNNAEIRGALSDLTNTTAAFELGVQGAAFHNGWLDEVGVAKYVASAAEKNALYNGGSGVTWGQF